MTGTGTGGGDAGGPGSRKASRRNGPPRPTRPQLHKPTRDPVRLTAYDLLKTVRVDGAYANLALPKLLAERGLSGRDAAFATELGYGTLRAQGQLDTVLQACVDRPLAQVDPPVLDVLRLGAYQLLRTRIPVHAAVSATVDVARTVLSAGPASFTNAVLRKVAAHDLPTWLEQLRPADAVDAMALDTAHPRWVAQAFRDALRGDLDEARAALLADDTRPHVHLVARSIDRDELARVSGGTAGPWSARAVRLESGGSPGELAAVRDGRAAVQDEGSQLMALALAQAPLEGPDLTWVDLCAGPGGKAALLDGLARPRGARLLAIELQPHRARLVRSSGVREVVVADGRTPPLTDGTADRVLLDAPCSGLGALRRRPEARWRRQPSDLPGLTTLQGELLAAAARLLRPGGVLAYVTCSPHLAETAVPVLDVLRRYPELVQEDARPLLPGVPDLGAGPAVQLWPHRHGTDAMFLAVFRRRS